MNIKRFLRSRKVAMLSMDRDKILAHMKKYNEPQVYTAMENASENVFWGAVHKGRTVMTDLPEPEREKSRQWLRERGWEVWG